MELYKRQFVIKTIFVDVPMIPEKDYFEKTQVGSVRFHFYDRNDFCFYSNLAIDEG